MATFEFDLRHFKVSADDFMLAFENAIQTRIEDLLSTKPPLFGVLSSGFDSGAIHAALHLQAVRHHAFALLGEELPELLHERALYARSLQCGHM